MKAQNDEKKVKTVEKENKFPFLEKSTCNFTETGEKPIKNKIKPKEQNKVETAAKKNKVESAGKEKIVESAGKEKPPKVKTENTKKITLIWLMISLT